MEKLASLPFTKVAHQVTTIDAQPIIGVDDNKVIFQKIPETQFCFEGCRCDGDWAVEDRR